MKILVLILIIFIISFSSSYVVLPFKRFLTNEPKEFFNANQIIDHWLRFSYLSELYIGERAEKIKIFIEGEGYFFAIFNKACDSVIDSTYDYENSKKFFKNDLIRYEMPEKKKTVYLASDSIHLLTYDGEINNIYSKNSIEEYDFNLFKKYEKFPFLFSPDDWGRVNICGQIGLLWDYLGDPKPDVNFFYNLKNLNIISHFQWTYEFFNDRNDEGHLIIGELPHVYDPNTFSEEQYYLYKVEESKTSNTWTIEIQDCKLDQEYKIENINDVINQEKSYQISNIELNFINNIIIDFNLYMIKAPMDLLRAYDTIFFNELYNDKICNYKKLENGMVIVYCDAEKFDGEIIGNFPGINFYIKEFNDTFSLDYDDLWVKKNGIMHLLIVFCPKIENSLILGQIFLKNYKFVFDPDNMEIGYYKTNYPHQKKLLNKLSRLFNFKNILLLFFLLGIGIVIFLWFKYINRDKNEKTKIIINNLKEKITPIENSEGTELIEQ